MPRPRNLTTAPRFYVVRITDPYNCNEFGPYLSRATAKAARTRELRDLKRVYGTTRGWTAEILSAPVGEWTEED